VDDLDENVLAFLINGGANGETSDGIYVIFNPNAEETTVSLPEGAWDVCINADTAGTEAITTIAGSATVEPISAMVLVKSDKEVAEISDASDTTAAEENHTEALTEENTGTNPVAVVLGIIAAVAVAGAAVFFIRKK
jgi:pullulanase